jgi:hypothetical protein
MLISSISLWYFEETRFSSNYFAFGGFGGSKSLYEPLSSEIFLRVFEKFGISCMNSCSVVPVFLVKTFLCCCCVEKLFFVVLLVLIEIID